MKTIMKTIVFCLEEPSAREMLKGLSPRIFHDKIAVRYIVFEGKQDMEKQIVKRLRNWKTPDTQFIVIRDQDAARCKDVKQRLKQLCAAANRPGAVVRIACHELESWYLGDLSAVEVGLKIKNLKKYERKAKYKNPDGMINPSRELQLLTKNKYQKVSGSRNIGPHLSISGNNSHSFHVLIKSLVGFAKM
jgi:hypothetical protein